MKKKALSLILAFIVCLSLLPAPVSATDVKPMDLSQVIVKDNLSYDYVGAYNSYVYVTDGGKKGLLDCDGNVIIPVSYEAVTIVSDSFVAVGQDLDNNKKTGEKNTGVDKYGLMDMDGNWVVPLRYDRIDPFYEDMAAVYLDNKMGFIDNTGKEVIPPIYMANLLFGLEDWPDGHMSFYSHSYRIGFSDGVVCVWKDGVCYTLDKQGQVLLTKEARTGFCDGRALVQVSSGYNFKFGYMDKQGNMVIPAAYDEAHDFSEGYAVVGKKNSNGEIRYGAIDQAGKIVVPLIYYGMTPFHEGMARVYEKDEASGTFKFGFVNTEGKLAVPMIYQGASNYSDGLAVVSIKDDRFKNSQYDFQLLYGCIDKQGKVAIPLEYCAPFEFSDGIAYVCKGYPSGRPLNANYQVFFESFCKKMRELGTPQECSCIDMSGKTVISFGDRGRDFGAFYNIFSGKIGVYQKSDGQYAIIRNPLYEEQTTVAFTDLLPWCEKEAIWAAQEKITNGYGGSEKFAPNVDCTQAQILTFLYRADRGEGPAKAEDMDLAIKWAKEKGIIDDTFDGSKLCTRATAVSYIWQVLGKQETTKTASFTDVDADAPYAEAVNWAVEKEITNGYGGNDTFSPDTVCKRGQIACFLYRAYNN